MNEIKKTTYTVKEVAFFTGLTLSKVRTLIKNGTINANKVSTSNGTRMVTRLEVSEEDLASFAFSNPELAGELMNMEFIRKYDVKKADDVDHDVNEEIGEKPDNGWGPAEFTDDDLTDNAEVAGGDNNEDVNIPDTPTAIFADESDCEFDINRMLKTLRTSEETYIDSISIYDKDIIETSARLDALNKQRSDLANQLLNIQRFIEHIEKNNS